MAATTQPLTQEVAVGSSKVGVTSRFGLSQETMFRNWNNN